MYYCCCNNTIPKQVAPVDSIWTDCCILCNWSMYNFSDHRPVWDDSDFIELAELLSGWWFPLSTNEPRPSRSIESWFTLCGVVSRQGVKWNVRVPRGWGIRIKIQQQRELSRFFLVKYLEGLLNRGWTLFCGAGVVYEPQLAKAPHRAVWCRSGRSRFSSPVCWSWWCMEGFLERRRGPILIGCVETPPARLLVYLFLGVPGSTSCTAIQR